jgi:FkbM family methyltransferase
MLGKLFRIGWQTPKPEYLFRPRQLLRRIMRRSTGPYPGYALVYLPWRLACAVSPGEAIGRSIWLSGIYDLSVTEALWRLIRPGDQAVDVGANIGYMTSIMTIRAGPSGTVWSFEPHPVIFEQLTANVNRWRRNRQTASMTVLQTALGDQTGVVSLYVPPGFENNHGLSSLRPAGAQQGGSVSVHLNRLDDITPNQPIAVLKIDVEGQEFEVLQGADKLLCQGCVSNILFEESNDYPSPATNYLTDRGYSLFALGTGWLGPVLVRPRAKQRVGRSWEPQSFLATREPNRVLELFSRPGWRSLRDQRTSLPSCECQ